MFVLEDTTMWVLIGQGQLQLVGEIRCLGGIVIDVDKYLVQLDGEGPNATVQTTDYSYNVYIQGLGNIFRYDSAHHDHHSFHHVHRYDVFNGDREGTVERCEWPTLGEVIERAAEWYDANFEQLASVRPH